MQQRRELILRGRVQGVGFRPFVYQLASRLKLGGWVRNEKGTVRLQIQGSADSLQEFTRQLLQDPPVTARPELQSEQSLAPLNEVGFSILASRDEHSADIHVPPDYFLCSDCLQEMNDPTDRRYSYPFINCTVCGPRYTIIQKLPYDRPNTSMATFPLCRDCQAEYDDPMNRRFHAEPVACPQCGPQLEFDNSEQRLQDDEALQAAVEALQAGQIITIKGIGGFHLCCDATNADSIGQLRQRKQRPDKPLALMFPASGQDELDSLRAELQLDSVSIEVLRSPSRPIVLLRRQSASTLPDNLAPGLDEIGTMLPYSPLHHLLLSRFDKPIVATSANLSGEPVLTDAAEVSRRLSEVTSIHLHHNRPIVRPADDPVIRIIDGQPRPLRLGRGTAPLELPLPGRLAQPILACGGQMKNSVALAWEQRLVISPHIGDLDAPRSQQIYAEVIADLQRLYEIEPAVVVCDNHPGYYSTRWAQQQPLPLHTVAHHHAHASIVAGEYPQENRWLVFTWDGVGLGEDDTLWGGEAMFGQQGHWQRVASWRPFRLPGGDRAAREPWRSAQSLCWQTDIDWPAAPEETALLHEAWQKQINSPVTTAVGRLFDAAAALTGLCQIASFEGQGPMWLEQQAGHGQHPGVEIPLYHDDNLLRSDWTPLLPLLLDEQVSLADRAYAFHISLARALVDQARQLQQQLGDFAIGLSGGVFQNRLLCELIMQQCQQQGLRVYLPQQVPVNDAGLCYGQIIEAMARLQQ